jgi:hypothetical protein
MIANTTLSVHTITRMRAVAPRSYGAPLVISCERGRDSTEITLFLDDQDLVDRLVRAINDVLDAPKKPSCPHEEAAYRAAAMHYLATGSYK